ncbi:MAG TPA: asparagine synthase C-terminal domain-containing protein, partial [Fluviicola sp.]|nr:asparagine synthase C-terminal domain-containing protein [Fluviicola sp.]
LMYSLSQLFTDDQINQLFNQPLQKIDTYYESTELTNYSLLAYAQAIDYQTYLLDDILQKVDRASMAASLESREPLLDHRLIEFAAQLPDNMKYRQGEKKWILKEIVHQYIPKTLMDRPKMGFAIPIENWLKNELRDLVEETISFDNLSKIDYLNATEVLKIKAEFYSGRKELGVKLWYILCFLLWNKKWNLD